MALTSIPSWLGTSNSHTAHRTVLRDLTKLCTCAMTSPWRWPKHCMPSFCPRKHNVTKRQKCTLSQPTLPNHFQGFSICCPSAALYFPICLLVSFLFPTFYFPIAPFHSLSVLPLKTSATFVSWSWAQLILESLSPLLWIKSGLPPASRVPRWVFWHYCNKLTGIIQFYHQKVAPPFFLCPYCKLQIRN